jgi:hypothetical protein
MNRPAAPSSGSQSVNQESLLEDAIADGVQELFKNRLYLKRFPLKSFAHTMLRHETYPSKFYLSLSDLTVSRSFIFIYLLPPFYSKQLA